MTTADLASDAAFCSALERLLAHHVEDAAARVTAAVSRGEHQVGADDCADCRLRAALQQCHGEVAAVARAAGEKLVQALATLEEPRLLTVEDVATRYGLNAREAYMNIWRGTIPRSAVFRLGSRVYVRVADLVAWERAGGTPQRSDVRAARQTVSLDERRQERTESPRRGARRKEGVA